MMAVKKIDGRYYLRGYVETSPIQKNIYIEFMVDTSQTNTTVSKPEAVRNLIKLESLETEKGIFEVGNQTIDVYVCWNYVIHVPNQSAKGSRIYRVTLDKVYIPFKNISANKLEADVSRLGLDFLEKFSINFQTLDLDRDQIMVLEDNTPS
jgi:predicted aspartyl protease